MTISISRLETVVRTIDETARYFRVFRENMALESYHNLTNNIQYVMEVLSQIGIEIEPFIELLETTYEAIANMNYVSASDILSYEIKPIIIEIINYYKEGELGE